MVDVKGKRWNSLVTEFRAGRESVLTTEEFLDQFNILRSYEMLYGPAVEVVAPMRIFFSTKGGNTNEEVIAEVIAFRKWMDA